MRRILSTCEINYVKKCIDEHLRIDGRAFDEFRNLDIKFGRNWGCCFVTLGKTKVLSKTTCEIQQPTVARPHEGILKINVTIDSDIVQNSEPDVIVHLNRCLEKAIKESRAIDLETLCIKQNEKVWMIRLNISILSHDGNLLDCASVAAISALAHFKHPDVTYNEDTLIVYKPEQKDLIPLVIHHFPVYVSYAVFKEGTAAVADPTLLEESVSEVELAFALNSYKELCSIYLGGKSITNPKLIMQCSSKAAARAIIVVKLIKEALEDDMELRKKGDLSIFQKMLIENIKVESVTKDLNKSFDNCKLDNTKDEEISEEETEEQNSDKMEEDNDENEENAEYTEESDDDDICFVPTKPKIIETFEIEDSEEDEVVILSPEKPKKKKKIKY